MTTTHLFGGSTDQQQRARQEQYEAWRRKNAGALARAAETMDQARTEREQGR